MVCVRGYRRDVGVWWNEGCVCVLLDDVRLLGRNMCMSENACLRMHHVIIFLLFYPGLDVSTLSGSNITGVIMIVSQRHRL